MADELDKLNEIMGLVEKLSNEASYREAPPEGLSEEVTCLGSHFPVPRSLFSPHNSASKKPPKAQPLFLVQRSRKQTFLQDFGV